MGIGLEAQLSPRFGRCPYFVIIDIDNMQVETLENMAVNAFHGAGIEAAQMLINENVQVVVTGNMGPNPFQVFRASGIKIFLGRIGKISDLFELYKRGELREILGPTGPGRHMGRGWRRRM